MDFTAASQRCDSIPPDLIEIEHCQVLSQSRLPIKPDANINAWALDLINFWQIATQLASESFPDFDKNIDQLFLLVMIDITRQKISERAGKKYRQAKWRLDKH
jgi:hypothetical protein